MMSDRCGLRTGRDQRMLFDMTASSNPLPTDIDALHALIAAERAASAMAALARTSSIAAHDKLGRQNDALRQIIKELQRARFGCCSVIEAEINGWPVELRRSLRQTKSRPLADALKTWLKADHARISKGSKLGEAIRYGLRHWDGLVRYLEDGRIEIDSNTVERSIRPIALSRNNALFAGHDQGVVN